MSGRNMKQTDIVPCGLCGQGVAHDGNIAFMRVTIDHMVLDLGAIRRQAGLEQMLDGHAAIAHAMGRNEDIARCVSSTEIVVCQDCFLSKHAADIWQAPVQQAET